MQVEWKWSRMVGLLAVAMVGLVGCGGANSDDRLWEDAGYILMDRTDALEVTNAGNTQAVRSVHQDAAAALDHILSIHAGGSEQLRRAIEAIRDGEQALADGSVSGAQADELRSQLDEYWSHVTRRELPPDFH